MALTNYEPLNLLHEINSLMRNTFSRTKPYDASTVETSHWLPAVDIKETDDGYLLSADVPGVDPKAIEIAMENNMLTIKGTKEEVKKESQDEYYREERTKGEFYRRFTLPDNADCEHIEAKSRNGVLQIRIPKKQVANARRIAVQDGE